MSAFLIHRRYSPNDFTVIYTVLVILVMQHFLIQCHRGGAGLTVIIGGDSSGRSFDPTTFQLSQGLELPVTEPGDGLRRAQLSQRNPYGTGVVRTLIFILLYQ